MKPDDMLEELTDKAEKLKNELMELEQMFNVVVSPFTTKFPSIVTFPEKSPVVPSRGPTKLVAVMIPDEFILWVCTLDNV